MISINTYYGKLITSSIFNFPSSMFPRITINTHDTTNIVFNVEFCFFNFFASCFTCFSCALRALTLASIELPSSSLWVNTSFSSTLPNLNSILTCKEFILSRNQVSIIENQVPNAPYNAWPTIPIPSWMQLTYQKKTQIRTSNFPPNYSCLAQTVFMLKFVSCQAKAKCWIDNIRVDIFMPSQSQTKANIRVIFLLLCTHAKPKPIPMHEQDMTL